MSEKGRKKALMLASENKVSIKYDVCPIQDCEPTENEYDVIALVYAHFPPHIRTIIHQKLSKSLKPGGTLLIEAFNKTQLGKKSGGPQALELLYSIDEMKSDFAGFEFIEATETTIALSEGEYHKGAAEIIRIIALKK
jgi:2-polyprenyl-3-methyl-5-hydroxy-6-metoxy-1,4-benzoquinol methylase